MVIRINPSQQSVWRNNDELQIGLAENKIVLRKLSRGQERLVALLYRGIADEMLEPIAAELDAEEPHQLVEQLSTMLLPRKSGADRLSQEFIDAAFAELAKASLVHSADGASVLTQRMVRTVNVDTLDRTGLLMVKALAAAGIGKIFSEDTNSVSIGDCANLGFDSEFLGIERVDAVAEIIERSSAPTLVENSKSFSEAKLDSVDLAILVAHQAITPRSYSRWMNRSVPHIAIFYEAESVWVSPLIVPGRTACLFCLDIHKTELDQSWPTIATQLLQSRQRFDDASSTLFAVGLAMQKTTACLDGMAGFDSKAIAALGYRLDSKTGEVREVSWSQQQSCSCAF